MTLEILSPQAAQAEVGALSTTGALPSRRNPSPQYLARMDEARRLFERVTSGDLRAMADLREALSTSDFPIVFGSVLDRELLAQYAALPSVWQQYARRTTVRDFRPKKLVDLLGGRGVLERVPELDEYPERTPTEGEYSLQVAKRGAIIRLSWEMIVNDDLDGFRRMPAELAQSAVDTEDYVAAQQLTDGDGPNAALFNATAVNGTASNLLSGNPALTTTALTDALTAIQSRRDADGNPVAINGFALVVPPALEVTARNILGASEIRITSGSQTTIVGNWLSGKVTLVVNPWLPVVDTGANAATTWYLVPLPSSSRPAVVVGFLRGHEQPDLRVKSDTGQRVGGGAISPEDGSFEVDDVAWRVRHVVGGTTAIGFAAAASNGSGA